MLYTLDPGLQPTIKDLLTLMIIISDNEATDVLADKAGRDNITRYAHSLGLEKTEIRFSDLDWDRTWLGTLDPAYRHASGDHTVYVRDAQATVLEVLERARAGGEPITNLAVKGADLEDVFMQLTGREYRE